MYPNPNNACEKAPRFTSAEDIDTLAEHRNQEAQLLPPGYARQTVLMEVMRLRADAAFRRLSTVEGIKPASTSL